MMMSLDIAVLQTVAKKKCLFGGVARPVTAAKDAAGRTLSCV
jgi:hypothetical protein